MFLRNCWYVAAWDNEVGREPFARTILNEPVVLFRIESGEAVALEDRCCHRQLPLSLGRIIGDGLQCGYHGLEFDRTGACVQVPGQTKVPLDARVKSYPVVEKWNWLWIWMGDPALADTASIPDWHWVDDRDWRTVKGNGGTPLAVACDYRLITDNLLDIAHLTYVHASSIGNEAIVEFPIKTERSERMITMIRDVPNRPAAPFYQWAGKFDGNVDRWLITTVEMPAYVVNDAGCVDVGTDTRPGHRDHGVEMRVLNLPTPETETTTHYFYAHSRHFGLEDDDVEDAYKTQFTQVFLEDKVVLEAQQRMMTMTPDAPSVDINTDAPSIAMRAMLNKLIAEENKPLVARAAE